MTKPKILNLSNKVFSQQHVNVYRRGFKFTSTLLRNKMELKNDVDQFPSKLRLLESFYTENGSKEEKSFSNSITKK